MSVSGASIAFASGAAIYYIRQKYKLTNFIAVLFILIFVCHFIFANLVWGFSSEHAGWTPYFKSKFYGLPLHTILAAFMLWALLDIESRIPKESPIIKRGNQLGKIAYAVFLCHWIVAYLLEMLGFDFYEKIIFVPLAFIGINLMAILLYRFVEYPLDKKFRDKIRGRKAQI